MHSAVFPNASPADLSANLVVCDQYITTVNSFQLIGELDLSRVYFAFLEPSSLPWKSKNRS